MINEETEDNHFKPCAQRIKHFSTVEIAEVDLDMPQMQLCHALQTMHFRLLE